MGDQIRISALNDTVSDGESKGPNQGRTTTKEAKEAEAFALYNKALGLQRQGEVTRAETMFKELLHHPFMQEAVRLVNEEGPDTIHPGLQVLYSTHKNMATIALQRADTTAAIESLLEAVIVDATEVTVWYKIGTLALKLCKYSLARFSFEQGLQCNPRHWPCLDNVITVLYVLNDYWHCLSYIAQALERDSGYTKGLVIRKQIYKEHAALKKDTDEFFKLCDPAIFLLEVDQTEADEFINEALEMRQKRRELAKVVKPPPVKLPTLANYTWRSLGRSLVALYDYITQSDPPKSLALRIDVSAYGPSAPETESGSDLVSGGQAPTSGQDTRDPRGSPSPPDIAMEVDQVPADDKPAGEITDPPVLLQAEEFDSLAPGQPVTAPACSVTSNGQHPPPEVTGSQAEGEAPVDVVMAETSAPAPVMPTAASPTTASAAVMAPVPSVTAAVALHDHPVPMEPGEMGGSKKGTKRKRLPLDQGTKRRSARVRNTNKKKEDEAINFHDLLQKFLPSSLMQVVEPEEEDADVQSAEEVDKLTDGQTDTQSQDEASVVTGCMPLATTEEADVREFLLREQKNSGLVSMMKHYLHFLSQRENKKWPDTVKRTYMEVYNRVRQHLKFPECPLSDGPDAGLKANIKMCLVYMELKMDQWLSQKVKPAPSPGPPTGSPRKSSPVLSPVLGADFPGPHFKDDIWFLCAMIGYSQILEDFWAEYAVRVYWLKARFCILSNNIEDAVGWFNTTCAYLTYAAENENKTEVILFQCLVDNRISEEHVRKQLESLERCQSLEEIQKFYDDRKYQKVVDCLLQTFRQPQTKHQRREGDNIPERHAQLLLLQDSLFKLSDFQKCIFWGEEILNEALQHYRHAYGSVREDWGATLTQVFAGINKCVSKEAGIIGSLPNSSLVRLTHNLIRVIEILMDTPDCITVVPIDTVLPWILLYKLIKHEENKLQSLSVDDGNALDGAITSSFMLLNVAHEYLGRRSWCTNSEGLLLKFIMDVLREEMAKDRPRKAAVFREEINQAFEQCSFCLYGHPNKKSRVKHLQDHGIAQLTLTWDKAIDLFEYFKPKTVPEFDSYKTSTVSGELEGLLRRISTLVPDKYRAGNTVELVQSYIEGNSTSPPTSHAEKCAKVPVVRELYYLLADYYFKNKEQMKAMKFYLLDLCYNPERLDSWAGLALARMSRLEQKLNSHELKMDLPVLKQSIPALRCFRRAVETDDTNSKLWIEYGCLAYELHSHASRQLKMKEWFPLAGDMLELARASQVDMLRIAQNCYQKANQCESDGNEEEWLHHYMMGKVAERQRRPPHVYLEHYKQAAVFTHEDKAVYPRKITYVVSPPHLAVESLEVFYRLHASSLKLLLNHSKEVDYKLVQKYLNEAAQSPFALSKEKRRESRESMSSGSDAELVSGQPATPTRRKQNYHMNPQDHNYSRQKSREIASGAIREGSVQNPGTVESDIVSMKTPPEKLPASGDAFTASRDGDLTPNSNSVNSKSTSSSENLDSKTENQDPKSTPCFVEAKAAANNEGPKAAVVSEGSTPVSSIEDPKPANVSVSSHLPDGQGDARGTHATCQTKTTTLPGKTESSASEIVLMDVDDIKTSEKVDSSTTRSCSKEEVDRARGSHAAPPSFLITDILGEAARPHQSSAPKNLSVSSTATQQQSDRPSTNMDSGNTDDKQKSSESSALPLSGNSGKSEKPNDSSAADTGVVNKAEGSSHPLQSGDKSQSVKLSDNNSTTGSDEKSVSKAMETDDIFSMIETTPLFVSTPVPSYNTSKTPTNSTKVPAFDPLSSTEPKTSQQSADGTKPVTTNLPSDSPALKPEVEEPAPGVKDEEKMECSVPDPSPPGFDHPKHKQLMDQCISALSLCLSRFPQHYKSLYRLAHLYWKSPLHKNLQFARDLLLGNPNWQHLAHMPAPGLFADRKSTDFFKGVWRIPIDEIDRSGSFPSHLNRSIQLILEVLREQKDASTLFLIHHQLSRVPDLGKKYLRDAERVWFAKQAFIYSVGAMEALLTEIAAGQDRAAQLGFILEVFRLWNYGVNKMATQVDRVNDLFALTFRTICKDKLDKSRPVLEQALLFCQEQITLARAQAPLFGSPRSQAPKASFMSPSLDRSLDLSLPYQTDAYRSANTSNQTAASTGSNQATATAKPTTSIGTSQLVSTAKPATSTGIDQSILNAKAAANTVVSPAALIAKPTQSTGSGQPAVTTKPVGAGQPAVTTKPVGAGHSAMTTKPVTNVKTGQSSSITKPASTARVGQSVLTGKSASSLLTSKTTASSSASVVSGRTTVAAQLAAIAASKAKAPQSEGLQKKPSPGALDLSNRPSHLASNSSNSGTIPGMGPARPVTLVKTVPPVKQAASSSGAQPGTSSGLGPARPVTLVKTAPVKQVASSPAAKSGDSLLTRLVLEPGEILMDVNRVIYGAVPDQAWAQAHPSLPAAEGRLVAPSQLPMVTETPLTSFVEFPPDLRPQLPPLPPPPVNPTEDPSCIVITDSESSLSSLLDYTIELNDSDFDEPIVIMSPDDA